MASREYECAVILDGARHHCRVRLSTDGRPGIMWAAQPILMKAVAAANGVVIELTPDQVINATVADYSSRDFSASVSVTNHE